MFMYFYVIAPADEEVLYTFAMQPWVLFQGHIKVAGSTSRPWEAVMISFSFFIYLFF